MIFKSDECYWRLHVNPRENHIQTICVKTIQEKKKKSKEEEKYVIKVFAVAAIPAARAYLDHQPPQFTELRDTLSCTYIKIFMDRYICIYTE